MLTAPSLDRLHELDPELAAALGNVPVPIRPVRRGPMTLPPGRTDPLLGAVLVDGLVAQEVLLADNVSHELLGPGDVLLPWPDDDPTALVPAQARWTAFAPARLALVHARLAVVAPDVTRVLVRRAAERSRRQSLAQAVAQLNGVDRRVLALFWLLAERWGRVTRDGVAVQVSVPHRVIAGLVGARRPTVSSALIRLQAEGRLVRRAADWLLTGDPVGAPAADVVRIIAVRNAHAA